MVVKAANRDESGKKRRCADVQQRHTEFLAEFFEEARL